MSINLDGLSESEAFDLFYRLKAKFDWTGTVTTMGDVIVYEEGEEAWWSDDAPQLTDAMREAVRGAYEWRKGIDERTSEIATEITPKIELLSNGNFILHTESDVDVEFTADGVEV